MKYGKSLLALGALLALVASACGGGVDQPAETLPPVPPGVETPPDLTGACLEGEPDCVDTSVSDDEPISLDDEPRGVGSGLVVDGGLTVADALASDATGVIAVQGFVVQDESGILLCELLAESLPPQCGGASIELAGLDSVDPDELSTAQGVTWTDFPVTILGEIADGVLVSDSLSL